MAPKRRAASAAKAGAKKVKEEPETQPKDAFTSAKEALLAAGPQLKSKRKVDEHCQLSSSGEVHHDPQGIQMTHIRDTFEQVLFRLPTGVRGL